MWVWVCLSVGVTDLCRAPLLPPPPLRSSCFSTDSSYSPPSYHYPHPSYPYPESTGRHDWRTATCSFGRATPSCT